MHFDHGQVPAEYRQYIGRKTLFILVMTGCLAAVLVVAISFGAANISISSVAKSLLGMVTSKQVEINEP